MTDETEADDALPPELEITLDPPLVLKGATYESIKLREPKAFEVQQAEAHLAKSVNVESLRKYGVALVSRVSGIPEAVILQLPVSKLNEATEYLQNFVDRGPRTGAN